MSTFLTKKNTAPTLYILLFFTFFISCKKEKMPPVNPPPLNTCNFFSIKIDGATCALDAASNTFYFSIKNYEMEFSPLIEVENQGVKILINNQSIENFAVNDLGLVKVNSPLPIKFIECDETEKNYQLIFTRHPIIQLQTNNQFIHNDPKIPIHFQLNDPDFLENGNLEREYSSIAGIELRGGAAQNYPKKAYAIELWKDSLGVEKTDASLLGMREDDDWILDAMYIDPARMRNRVSTDLWLDFQNLHYQNLEPNAKNGTQGKFVEVFLDNQFWGIYTFTERIDRKQLKLKTFDSSNDFGLLYKSVNWENGTVNFENYFDFDPASDYWEGWLQKYPDAVEEGVFWNPLADFTYFVINSSDVDFQNQISQKLNIENAVDYFILLNLLRADDNTGKNIYFSKYNSTDNFFMVPWDLDGTWGRLFDGSETSSEGILSYNLFDRLINLDAADFRNQLKTRWTDLRNNAFTKNTLLSYFENYAASFEQNGSFEREKTKWDLQNDLAEELNLISTWLDLRLVFLDDYFLNL